MLVNKNCLDGMKFAIGRSDEDNKQCFFFLI